MTCNCLLCHDFAVVAVSDNKKDIASDWEWLEGHLLNTLCERGGKFFINFSIFHLVL